MPFILIDYYDFNDFSLSSLAAQLCKIEEGILNYLPLATIFALVFSSIRNHYIMARYLRICTLLAVAATAAAIIVSCTKTDFTGPTLASNEINYKRTFIINPGEKVNLISLFLKPDQLSNEWTMDGQVLAKEGSSYTFSSSEPGSYIITQRVYNGIAEVYIDYYVVVRGPYGNGTLILTNSSTESQLTFVSKDNKVIDENAYKTANPGKTLGLRASSATAFYGKMYILTDSEIIVLNSQTLKEITRITTPSKPNYLLNVDRSNALLSTDNGIYKLNITPLQIGNKIVGLNDRVGKMVKNDKYVMALSINGVVAINSTTLLITRNFRSGKSDLVADIGGNFWTTNGDSLIFITSTLQAYGARMANGLKVTSSWNPWNEGTLTLSSVENTLLFIKANDDGTPSRSIYKLDISNPRSVKPSEFIKIPDDRNFVGIGFRINSENNIVATTVNSSGGDPQMAVYRTGDATFVGSVPTTVTNTKSILFNNTK